MAHAYQDIITHVTVFESQLEPPVAIVSAFLISGSAAFPTVSFCLCERDLICPFLQPEFEHVAFMRAVLPSKQQCSFDAPFTELCSSSRPITCTMARHLGKDSVPRTFASIVAPVSACHWPVEWTENSF